MLGIRIIPRTTAVLILLCVAVYAFEALRFGWSPTAPELHLVGGMSRGAVEVGNWWALVAANLLHASPAHIVLNLVLLLYVGWFVEWAWGARVAALALVVGAVGTDAAAVLAHPDLVGIGASGLVASLVGFGLLQPGRSLPTFVLRMVAIRVALFGLVDYVLVLADPDAMAVNNAAHLGGLAGGALVAGALWVPRMRGEVALRFVRRVGTVLAVGVLVAAGIGSAGHVIEVNRFAWTGVGSSEPENPPPADLVELTLDGIVLDGIGTVRDPDCESGSAAYVIRCDVRPLSGGRAIPIDISRADAHLDFRFVERRR